MRPKELENPAPMSFKLEESDLHDLRVFAAKQGVAMSVIIRRAIKDYMETGGENE